jgi:transcriptional regulator with XRE-family HTH domain
MGRADMRADRLLIENIQHLLSKRGHKQKELADWCGHSETWISSIFRGERQFRITDYDKIADFFGIAVYQLFQPGIAPITERRKPHSDRRSGEDRRVSKAHRAMLELRDEIDAARPRRPKPAEAED